MRAVARRDPQPPRGVGGHRAWQRPHALPVASDAPDRLTLSQSQFVRALACAYLFALQDHIREPAEVATAPQAGSKPCRTRWLRGRLADIVEMRHRRRCPYHGSRGSRVDARKSPERFGGPRIFCCCLNFRICSWTSLRASSCTMLRTLCQK